MKSYLLLGFVSLLYENQTRFSPHFRNKCFVFAVCLYGKTEELDSGMSVLQQTVLPLEMSVQQ
jgi:hypothetical protein